MPSLSFQKVRFLCIVFLSTLPLFLSAQWDRQYPLEKLEDVLDIDISGDGYGFAVGTNDLMLRLDKDSKTWELLDGFGSNWRFESVDYMDGTNGMQAAAGGPGLIFTTDGGDSWNEIAGAPFGINALRMYPDRIIAVADGGVFVWKDFTWNDLDVPAPTGLKGGFILDSLHMWVYSFATNPAIYYTSDGGDTWDINLDITDIDVVRFYNDQIGIATDARDVYHSWDGGASWTLTGNNALQNTVNDLTYSSDASVLIGAAINAEPQLSVDSGRTWTALESDFINQRSYSVASLDPDVFWVGNDLSSIIRSDDGGDSWVETSGPDRNLIQDLFFLNGSDGFASGLEGMLLRTMDGGENWEDISFGTRSHLTLHGTSVNDLWMGGSQRIFHSVDTGNTWTESLVLIGSNINDIHAISTEKVLAVSASGVIYRTINGGAKWDSVYVASPSIQLKSVSKIDDQRYMAVGFGGTILRSNDQGATWQALTPPEAGLQYDQTHFVENTGWLVTSSFKNLMWKTTNAGDSWTPVTLPIDRFWDGVYFISPDTGIIVGRATNEGRAYITFTGGASWSSGHILTYPLFGVNGLPHPNGTAWIFGYGSDIEKLQFCTVFPAITNFQGELFPCQGDTMMYTIAGENVDDYAWFFPPGWQILGNANNDTVLVKIGATSGFISISGSNACGETGQLNFSAGANILPLILDIQGDLEVCTGDIVTYTATPVNADYFIWDIPADWAFQSDPNLFPEVMVLVGQEFGEVTVSAVNECGTSEASFFPADPQPIPTLGVSGDLNPCAGDTVIYTLSSNIFIDVINFTIVSGSLSDWEFNLVGPSWIEAIAGSEAGSLGIGIGNICGSATAVLDLDPVFVPEVDITANGSTLQLSVNDNQVQYQWYMNGQPIPGANAPTYTITQSGNYYATLLFPSGCSATSIALDAVISSVSNQHPIPIRVYPVPVSEKLFVEGIESVFEYTIYDIAGRVCQKNNSTNSEVLVNMLANGLYSIHVIAQDKHYVAKFVKN